MGLDMYLQRVKKNELEVKRNGVVMYDFHQQFESSEIGYWRKANAIHDWFCREFHCEINCSPIVLSEDDIQELYDICDQLVKAHDENLCKELLPTCSGFFFGSTEYDEWYYEDLKLTMDILNRAMEETDWDTEIVFYDAWW